MVPLLGRLPVDGSDVRPVVSGDRLRWPGSSGRGVCRGGAGEPGARGAEAVLAAAYQPGDRPLVVVSGDGPYAIGEVCPRV